VIEKSVINEVTKRLVKVYNPIAIYIFGSYSWGTPTPDSDLDLLIVIDKSEEKNYTRPVAGHKALADLDISKDIIVYTQEEFEELSRKKSTLAFKIKKEGSKIYARA
jgi:predicted nucleotidyltransferase